MSVILYDSDQLECMELCLGMGEELWVMIKEREGTGDITVGGLLQATWPGALSG